jgi:hypothetical protein
VVRRIAISFLLTLVACISQNMSAQEAQPAVYQRVSTQAEITRASWAHQGGGLWSGGNWGSGGWGWGSPGFYNPWMAPQVFGGTWYQRPYPDHLIYNNVRSRPPLQAICLSCEPDTSASGAYGTELQGTNAPRPR